MKLQEIAGYLPYGFKMKSRTFSRRMPDVIELTIHNLPHLLTLNRLPVLRPLSDLTKPITVNGEEFVPIEVIGKLFVESGEFEDGLFGWNIPTGGDDYQDYYFNIAIKNDVLHLETWGGKPNEKYAYVLESHAIEYTVYNQLIKWHFDLHGLIEKGKAIDINTLK
jgi:hypothetical protein